MGAVVEAVTMGAVMEAVQWRQLRAMAYIDVAGIDVVRTSHTWYLFQFHPAIIICKYYSGR